MISFTKIYSVLN